MDASSRFDTKSGKQESSGTNGVTFTPVLESENQRTHVGESRNGWEASYDVPVFAAEPMESVDAALSLSLLGWAERPQTRQLMCQERVTSFELLCSPPSFVIIAFCPSNSFCGRLTSVTHDTCASGINDAYPRQRFINTV